MRRELSFAQTSLGSLDFDAEEFYECVVDGLLAVHSSEVVRVFLLLLQVLFDLLEDYLA